MTAHAAILEALIARGRTGQGRRIRDLAVRRMADWMNVPLMQRLRRQAAAARGLAHPSIAPYGVFAPGRQAILISIQSDREWPKLCADVLGAAGHAGGPALRLQPRRAGAASRED